MKKSILVSRIPTTVPNVYIDVTVYYDKGWDGSYHVDNPPKRGHYALVVPVNVEHKEINGVKYDVVISTAYSGTKFFIEETKRFSDKQLNVVANAFRTHPMYDTMVKTIVERNLLTVTH
jgi:hypothetical protein